MPVFTKIGSMLRDEPVLAELRELVRSEHASGLPHADALGLNAKALAFVDERPGEIEAQLSTRPVAESVVALTGRPSLLVRGDSFELPPLRVWRHRLQAAMTNLEAVLPSVGRVELLGSDLGWIGTGWMLGDRDVITNRHVAVKFARSAGRGFAITNDITGRPYDVRMDFREEFQGFRAPYEVSVTKVLHIEADGGRPDLAVLQLASTVMLPRPLPLGDDPDAKQYIATIGYPARDPEIPLDVAQRVFGNVYDVKRLAPGQVIPGNENEPAWAFSHDCTTLGGNSGSVAVDLETGAAVGLHFAGAYRSANFAVKASAIKKILKSGFVAFSNPTGVDRHVTEERPALTARDYAARPGYRSDFLGRTKKLTVPLPGLGKHASAVARLKGSQGHELAYEHFATVQHAARRLPLLTAVNVDGRELRRLPRPGEHWNFDPRIDKRAQVGAELYTNNDYDRGHMVRRIDPVWGPTASTANDDTFHWTNCTPQHHELNNKIWNDLEDYILDNADAHEVKVSVFTGPVLSDSDPVYRAVQIPQEYWKIVAFRPSGTSMLSITAYMLSQGNLSQPMAEETPFVFGRFRTYQVPVKVIGDRTGLDVAALARHDPLRRLEAATRVRRIDWLEQIIL